MRFSLHGVDVLPARHITVYDHFLDVPLAQRGTKVRVGDLRILGGISVPLNDVPENNPHQNQHYPQHHRFESRIHSLLLIFRPRQTKSLPLHKDAANQKKFAVGPSQDWTGTPFRCAKDPVRLKSSLLVILYSFRRLRGGVSAPSK